jgi:hypothetical protein
VYLESLQIDDARKEHAEYPERLTFREQSRAEPKHGMLRRDQGKQNAPTANGDIGRLD